MSLTKEDVQILVAPFPKDKLGVKVQSLSKNRDRAMLVLYLQHTDVMGRLDEVDPAWKCEVLDEKRAGDTYYVKTRMTLKGVSRENVGEGSEPKGAYSDALKRAAMLFGVGRYLYDSTTPWVAYNEQQDKFKSWTVAEFEAASREKVPSPGESGKTHTPTPPQTNQDARPDDKEVQTMIAAFKPLGVTLAMIEDAFPGDPTQAAMSALRVVYDKIKKGAKPTEFFKSDATIEVAKSLERSQANKKPLVSPKPGKTNELARDSFPPKDPEDFFGNAPGGKL